MRDYGGMTAAFAIPRNVGIDAVSDPKFQLTAEQTLDDLRPRCRSLPSGVARDR
jgi:hypothetical protein